MALIIAGGMAFTGLIGFWYGSKNHCMIDGESCHSCLDCKQTFKAKQLDCNWRCVSCQDKYGKMKAALSKKMREENPYHDYDPLFDP